MKRILPFLLIFLVAADAVWCIAVRPRQNEAAALLAEYLPTRSGLADAQRNLAESAIFRHAVSGDWLKPQPLDPLELVPEDALLTLDAESAFAAAQSLVSSPFGQTVASIRWNFVLKQLGVPLIFRRMLEQQTTEAKSLLANPLLQDVFSRRTVTALLPPETGADPLRTLPEHVLLITTPKAEANKELFSAALNTAAGKRPELIWHYGIGILVFDLSQGRKLHVATIGGRQVVSLSIQPVRRSIEVFIRHFFFRQNGMLRSRDYVEMKAGAQGRDDFFLYADLARLRSLFGGGEETAGIPYASSTALRSLSFFHQRDGKAVQFKTAVRFAPEQLAPVQKELLAAAPMLNRTIGKMPSSLPFYFWSGWLEPNFWQLLLTAEGKEDAIARTESWFKGQTGLSLSEILSLFGREFSVNVASISTTGLFPVPRLCFVLEVREQKKAEQLLAKLTSGLPVIRDKVAGTQVVSLMAAKGMMQPSYAFADGFLLLADSREQIEDILEGQSERLPENAVFQTAAAGMKQPSNLMFFARAPALVDALKELAAWAGTMTAINDEQAGAKSKVLVDQVVIPLLDSLSACGAVSLRSVVRPGELLIEASALHAEKISEKTGAVP